MNKKRVDEYIPRAYEMLKAEEIAVNGEIDPSFRGQIASFGAMIAMGSVLSAVALFSGEKSGAEVDRLKLMRVIYDILRERREDAPNEALFIYVREQVNEGRMQQVKEEIEDAAIAVKLAMNLYNLQKKGAEKNVVEDSENVRN